MSEHVTESELKFHAELGRLAGKHLGGVLGLELLPYDPTQRPDQRLDTTHFDIGPDASLASIRGLAGIALQNDKTGRLDELVEAFRSRRDLMIHMNMDLEDGKNIGNISEHTSLYGIAILQAAQILARGEERYVRRNATVMSKLITRLSVFGGMPATDVLSNLGRSYYSVPRTKSIFRSGIDNDLATEANHAMLEDLHEFLGVGGQTIAIAPSGSIDERTYHRGRLQSISMQRMSSGTARLLAGLDRLLPAAIWLDAPKGQPWFKIGELTESVRDSPDKAHETMEWLADALSSLARVPVEYEAERLHGAQRAKELGEELAEKSKDTYEKLRRRLHKDEE